VGRCPLDGRHHRQKSFFHLYHNADAAEFTMRIDLQFFESLGGQQGRMGIKPLHHALDSLVEKLFCFHGIDIIFFHQFNHIGE